jgi:hypothetical protein
MLLSFSLLSSIFQMTGILTLASAVGQAMKAPKLDRLPRSFRVRTYIYNMAAAMFSDF